jgi:beta-lactamase superfamily II metal-dependent hydrolase
MDLATSDDANNESLVMKLTWGDVSFLLTGDIEDEAEDRLVRSGVDLRSTVLKVAHHGSATSSTAAFVEAVQPELAVVSVGANNPFGHPVASVVDRLAAESAVLRTDEHGTIDISTDGNRVWVETAR